MMDKQKISQEFFCSHYGGQKESSRFFVQEEHLEVWKSYQDREWVEYEILETHLYGYSISFTLTELGRSLIDLSRL
jgi:hypothetical protein